MQLPAAAPTPAAPPTACRPHPSPTCCNAAAVAEGILRFEEEGPLLGLFLVRSLLLLPSPLLLMLDTTPKFLLLAAPESDAPGDLHALPPDPDGSLRSPTAAAVAAEAADEADASNPFSTDSRDPRLLLRVIPSPRFPPSLLRLLERLLLLPRVRLPLRLLLLLSPLPGAWHWYS